MHSIRNTQSWATRLPRLLRAFTRYDGMELRDLRVGLGAYTDTTSYDEYGDDVRGRRPRLRVCRTHWRVAHERPSFLDRLAPPPGGERCDYRAELTGRCSLYAMNTYRSEKDVVEVSLATESGQKVLRTIYVIPSVLSDSEQRDLYVHLRERGDDPDTARNSVLTLGYESIDRLLAQIRAGTI